MKAVVHPQEVPMVDFADIKRRVPIEKAAELLHLELTHERTQLRGPCPVCPTDDPRALAITPTKGFFCFAMKKGGSCIDLVMHITGLELKEAAEFLDPAPHTRATSSSPSPARRKETSKEKSAPKGFDKAKFADSLGYDGEIEGLSKENADLYRIGTKRGKLYLPICPPDVEPVCWAELQDGKLRLPDEWLPSNVVRLKRPA